MDATRRPTTEIGRAVLAHTRAIARLINGLKHRDESVRAEAAAALRGLDPPATWPLAEALRGSRDTAFRIRIVEVLVSLYEVDQVRILCILADVFKDPRDAAVQQAAARALLPLVAKGAGPDNEPGESPGFDPDSGSPPRDPGTPAWRAGARGGRRDGSAPGGRPITQDEEIDGVDSRQGPVEAGRRSRAKR